MRLHFLIPGVILIFMHRISQAEKFDLSAYEYIHKFQTPLTLGSCPTRVVKHESGKTLTETCPCPAGNKGSFSDARSEHPIPMSTVKNASHLLDVIGLCEGRAASYIGILNGDSDECLATEISKLMTFSKKHVTYAYKEFYQTKVYTLNKDTEDRRHEDLFHHVEDSVYLNRIGYGGLEVILIQIRFSNSKEAEKAAAFHMDFLPSKNLKNIARVAGTPKKIMVIMLSTISPTLKVIRKYKGSQSVNQVFELLKGFEERMRWNAQHKDQTSKPISYDFAPCIETSKVPVKPEESSLWKEVCLLEIKAHKLYKAGKKMLKPCKSVEERKILPLKLRRPSCKNITLLMKDAKLEKSLLHNNRSLWYRLTTEEKIRMANLSSEKISSVQSEINKEAIKLKSFKKGFDLEIEF